MIQICCDICEKPVASYTEKTGKIWEDFTMRERRKWKPQIRHTLWYESLWHELHICGKCRKAIAEYLPKGKSMKCLLEKE